MKTSWCHVAVLACLSIKFLTSQVQAESIICDNPDSCAIAKGYYDEESSPEKRFLRFGRALESDEDDLLRTLILLQSEENSYRKRRSTDSKTPSQHAQHRSRRSVGESPAEVRMVEQEEKDADELLEAKRFMRFGRRDDEDVDKRFMRFGKRFMRFGRDPDKRFMRFGRDPDKRFMRFGRAPEKRFMRFGRSFDDEKRFMRFGRGLENLDSVEGEPYMDEPQGEFGSDVDKRFMRFGKRFMRFGKREDGEEDMDKRFMRFGKRDFEEPEDKRFMRFGRRFMRFGKSLANDDIDKRFMRFGKRFMRFGKRDTSSVEDSSEPQNT